MPAPQPTVPHLPTAPSSASHMPQPTPLPAASPDAVHTASHSAPHSGVPAHGHTPLTLWLRAVLWGSVLVPLLTFVLAGWWGYERALKEAAESVGQASNLTLRHAERSMVIAHGIAERADAVASADDAELRATEPQVHQRLDDLVAGLPSIVNLNLWAADGRQLVGSDTSPVDRTASVADRAYFIEQRKAVVAGQRQVAVSEVLIGRQSGLPLFNLTIPRRGAGGAFNGVVSVSMAPGFFLDYYRSLSADDPRLASFSLIRTDGVLLARWPAAANGRLRAPADSPVLRRVRAGEMDGIQDLAATDGREARIASFRKLPGYPLYVVAGVSRAGVLADWYHFLLLLAASLVPLSAGLVLVSWVALKKTRREQSISAELQQQIERRAEVERAMVESQKLATLAQLTGGVAHDFNNLLAIISTNLHVHRRAHPQVNSERPVQAMDRAVRAGVRLTRQLLSFSRRQALNPEVIQLQDWLPALSDLLRTTLNRNIELDIQVADGTQAICVDAAELELALINAALNAQHAMPVGGKLHVSAANASGAEAQGVTAQALVMIAVRDSGAGMPADVQARAFEPFFSTKPAGTGSGLGLTQVNGLCMQAGGFASIDSTPGSGTSVNLFFPAVAGQAPATRPAPATPVAGLRGTVLLVEDNPDVASATETLLRTAGLQVIRAANTEHALAHLTRGGLSPDVVVSDISMPGDVDGIGLAFALRARWPALPVLLTTGYAERLNDAVMGGFQVIAKPAAPEQLLGAVAAALGAVPRPASGAVSGAVSSAVSSAAPGVVEAPQAAGSTPAPRG